MALGRANRTLAIRTLCDHSRNTTNLSQRLNCQMCRVRSRSMQIRPSEETSSPVAFACLVVCCEFMIVDWTVGLVEPVCAVIASVVCETRCDRDACAAENESFTVMQFQVALYERALRVLSRWGEEVYETFDSTGNAVCDPGYQFWRRQGFGVRYTHQWHGRCHACWTTEPLRLFCFRLYSVNVPQK